MASLALQRVWATLYRETSFVESLENERSGTWNIEEFQEMSPITLSRSTIIYIWIQPSTMVQNDFWIEHIMYHISLKGFTSWYSILATINRKKLSRYIEFQRLFLLSQFSNFDISKIFKIDMKSENSIEISCCLTTLFIDRKLYTDSILTQFEKFMSQLTINSLEQISNLTTYTRILRQARYFRKDQRVLNVFVNKAIDWLNNEVENLQRQVRKPSQRYLRIATIVRMKNSDRSIRASCLKKENRDQIGQAFQGRNLVFKRKCPFCTTYDRLTTRASDKHLVPKRKCPVCEAVYNLPWPLSATSARSRGATF